MFAKNGTKCRTAEADLELAHGSLQLVHFQKPGTPNGNVAEQGHADSEASAHRAALALPQTPSSLAETPQPEQSHCWHQRALCLLLHQHPSLFSPGNKSLGFAHLARAVWHFLTSGAAKHPICPVGPATKAERARQGSVAQKLRG